MLTMFTNLGAEAGLSVVDEAQPEHFSAVPKRSADELQRLVPRGFVRSAIAIFVVNSVYDLVP